jgi:hypothetical protein
LRLLAEGLPLRIAQTGLMPGQYKALSPALAAYAPQAEWALLASVDTMQQAWRAEFAVWLQTKIQNDGICVIGNAASLAGQGLGQTIDAHAAVARFNHFARPTPPQRRSCGKSLLAPSTPRGEGLVECLSPSPAGGRLEWGPAAAAGPHPSLPPAGEGEEETTGTKAYCAPLQDVGQRLDVWVASPGYRGPAPQQVQWIVMTGPDVRYTLYNWKIVLPLLTNGARVLTVPLDVWRKLVLRLQAPPSAGVLLLQWLHDLNKGWQGITAGGIGAWTGTGAYHMALEAHKADSRHRWPAEYDLVAHWQEQGLKALGIDPSNTPTMNI